MDSLAGLLKLIRSYPNPLEFSVHELDYQDVAHAWTLVGVIMYLLRVQTGFNGSSEAARLTQWANAVKPSDYETLGIPGFALSGFQYLRILFGAQTVKPAVHIRRFVSKAVGQPVANVKAIALLEAAGNDLGWSLADIDYAVWDTLARDRT